MTDAKERLRYEFGDILSETLSVHELIYADNMFLIDASGKALEKYMRIIEDLGREYGLQLNWKKIELVSVRGQATVLDPNGNAIPNKDAFTYLGAQINRDGKIDSELSRRLGLATANFYTLKRI